VFVKPPASVDSLEASIAWGGGVAEYVNKGLPKYMELEFEAVLRPLLLFCKKRYASIKYETAAGGKMYHRGLQIVRRDSSPFVRETMQQLFDKVLLHQDVEGALALAQQRVGALLSGEVPLEKLILSRALRAEYKNEKQAHVQLVKKIEKRSPGSEPKPGDRVQYVMVPALEIS